jgi:hypothetical protein
MLHEVTGLTRAGICKSLLRPATLLMAVALSCAAPDDLQSGGDDAALDALPAATSSPMGVVLSEREAEVAANEFGLAASGCWTPGRDDIAKLEAGLRNALERGRANPESLTPRLADSLQSVAGELGKILDHFGQLRRQYVGFISHQGVRRILVNSFPASESLPSEDSCWWQHVKIVDDGGFWYWRIEYDVESGLFTAFDSNGYA